MTPTAWRLAARLLDATDREAIIGDLTESAASPFEALRDVLGLVLRRRAILWKNWRPWLAALGIALPGALLLMGLSLTVSANYQLYAWIIRNYGYIDPNILNETGLTLGPGVGLLLAHLFLLIACSWTAGFVVTSLSSRTFWISAVFCLSPCLFSLARFAHQTVSPFCLFLFLLPAFWGARQGLRRTHISFHSAFVLAAAVTLVSIPITNPRRWLYNCLLCGPAWYLAATSFRAGAVTKRNETVP